MHIPKTAGHSICAVLNEPVQHLRASETMPPRFTVVRNPYDRLVSVYEYCRELAEERFRELADGKTFREFLETDDMLFMLPQSHWIDDDVQFIARFERLEQDFATISDKPLPRLNASKRRPWQEYYDDEARSIVARRYAEDFRRFSYVA